MEFRTKVTLPKLSNEWKISYDDGVLLLGSCFSDSVGLKMQNVALRVCSNPFGTLYNPYSIAAALNRLMRGNEFIAEELFERDGLYHSFMHHSQFSDISVEKTLQRINESFIKAHQHLKTAQFLIVTFGTAWVYSLVDSGQIVANCHKLPEKNFLRNRLSVVDVVSAFEKILANLQQFQPNLRVVFTVSPIRHFRDGAHDNQLSKSTLLLAINELCYKFSNVCYFPAYEIVLDELRDYRFFANDMTHPSDLAVQYVWECFSEMFFEEKTKLYFPKIEKIRKAFLHRPFNENTEVYATFLKNINAQKRDLEKELGVKIC